MKSDIRRRKVRFVNESIPLPASANPYANRLGAVRRLMYARFQAALDYVRCDGAGRVMDFGCWAGYFLPSLLGEFAEVWGVDDDSASVIASLPERWTVLELAKELCDSHTYGAQSPRLVKAEGSALPLPNGYFEVVFCLDTLAHISPLSRPDVVRELRRITKRNGQVIFSLPVEIGPVLTLKTAMRKLTGKLSDPNMTGYDFRADLQLLRSTFQVHDVKFLPLPCLRSLNPTVMVTCRIAQERFAGSTKGQDPAAA